MKDFVKKMVDEKIENRINFNSLSEEEYNSFINNFNKEKDNDKINYLREIIEIVDENDLLTGNYKTFFNNDSIKVLLKKCL